MEIVGKVGLDEVEEIWKIILRLKTYSEKNYKYFDEHK
jgi:hypothetical protein